MQNFNIKSFFGGSKGSNTTYSSLNKTSNTKKTVIRVLKWVGVSLGVLILVLGIIGISIYFWAIKPALNVATQAKVLKASTANLQLALKEQNLYKAKKELSNVEKNIDEFKTVYDRDLVNLKKLPIPNIKNYYADGNHLILVSKDGLELAKIVIDIVEPYSKDLGFTDEDGNKSNVPADQRVVKLLSLMPQFSPKVKEISARMQTIDAELNKIDASKYPNQLPGWVKYFKVDPELNLRSTILEIQGISKELASKAPQFESLFNAIPEFMGLTTPKRYLVLMANNYELRMAGGFNTYIVGVEFKNGLPEIFYSIDTYFLDEGSRTGNSLLVNRNVPSHLRNYLYLSGNTFRWYARDATSNSPDFQTAANDLLTQFWRKDRTLPQNIDGVMQINNDLAVDILRAVGPVNTDKFSVLRDDGKYVTIPLTEFNADNVIEELENISGGKLAELKGRKDIIKYLGENVLRKMFTSEATNLIHIAKVVLDSLSKKDVILGSFDVGVQKAFRDLGYSGEIKPVDDKTDYLMVNRSNYGSGKADWTKPGFVSEEVKKTVELKDGKKISTVEVTIKNPKRPDGFNIDPCCFYKAYNRIYVPFGSKLVSVVASDGKDPKGAIFDDLKLGKTYIESFTFQPKESDLIITYVYELPDTIDLDNYKLLVQRQPGKTMDPYSIRLNGIEVESFLLNTDKEVRISK